MPVRRASVATFLISVFFCACTADLTDEPPSQASSPSPPDSASNQSTNLQLSWAVGSDESDPTFDLYIGTSPARSFVVRGLTTPHYRPQGLIRNTTYYWQVNALNAGGLVKGDRWTFTTTSGSSPDVPGNPTPADGSEQAVVQVMLEWTGGDADEDTVVYDVYFGRETDPPLAAEGLRDRYAFMPVPEKGTYYWRVVARDHFGLTAESPTWSFRVVPIPGHIYNWAGTGVAGLGAPGQPPLETTLYWPVDVSFSPDGTPFVVDWNNHRIIAPDASGNFKLIAGANGDLGDPCMSAPPGCQDIVAAGAQLNQPSNVAFDAGGNLVLSAWHNSALFLIDKNTGLMDRICGAARSFSPDGEAASTTFINLVASAVYGPDGRLYYTDQANMIIRMIDESGNVHTVAGTNPVWDENLGGWYPQFGYGGDGGPATSALLFFDRGQLAMPSGKICFDPAGIMYIADTLNHCVRRIDPAGNIHLFAGQPLGSPISDLVEPRDVAADSQGNVFIADSGRNMILMVNPSGHVSIVAGTTVDWGHLDRDGGEATRAKLDEPFGIEIDSHDNLWIADTGHSRIRIVYR